ncbi:MAG: hypothetical protein HFF88_04050 [Oscillibacter sp.]|jgi:predicted RNA-binding Zn-ribbon protein involved in translation (DUF1610 family)|nr:hypothetical protein [Oscillibacter sp.]
MGVFQKLGNTLSRFMYGRNGMDQLNRVLLWLYIALFFAGRILGGVLKSALWERVLDTAVFALMLLLLFRIFSKNLYKRQAENQKWLNWRWAVRSRAAAAKARHMDKDHKYFTCKSCKAICRVPTGKGNIVITCPKCGEQIKART